MKVITNCMSSPTESPKKIKSATIKSSKTSKTSTQLLRKQSIHIKINFSSNLEEEEEENFDKEKIMKFNNKNQLFEVFYFIREEI